MYTLCPHCSTCFRITAEQVNIAHGNVRCGNCGAVFNALDNPGPEPDSFANSAFSETEPFLAELYRQADDELHHQAEQPEPPGDPQLDKLFAEPDFVPLGEDDRNDKRSALDATDQQTLPDGEARTRNRAAPAETLPEPLLKNVVDDPSGRPGDEIDDATIEELEKLFLPDESPDPEPVTTSPEDGAVSKPAKKKRAALPTVRLPSLPSLPHLPRLPRLSAPSSPIALSAGSLLLIGLLLSQYVYFSRDHLARQYPGSRPLLESMCGHLGCKLALRRDLGKLQLTHRDVRSHPTIENALLINATFVNKAPFPQPYPLIELKLSSINGKLIGKRTFPPHEYLAGKPDLEAGLPPDTQVYLTLELADPGKRAVNYEFDFR